MTNGNTKNKKKKQKIPTPDEKVELYEMEIKKFNNNLKYVSELIKSLKQKKKNLEILKKEDKAKYQILKELIKRRKDLIRELEKKRLDLKLYKKFKKNKKDLGKKQIEYNKCLDIDYKEARKNEFKWLKRIKNLKEEYEFKLKSEENDFKPYCKDPFMVFTYDIITGKNYNKNWIPYPFNCLILTLLILPFYIISFYIMGGFSYLYDPGQNIGVFESTTFILLTIVLPIALIIMKQIYEEYSQTFIDMRKIAKVNKKDYEDFIAISNWSLQSPNVKYYWLIFSIGVIIFGTYMYLNPSPGDLIDNVGIIGLIIFITVWIISFIIIITISWHLISIVRTIRRFCKMPLDIRPLDPDKAAGLKPLAKLSYNISLIALLGFAVFIYSLFIGGRNLDEPFIFIILILIFSMMIILFVMPLANAHNIMFEKKAEILKVLSDEHNLVYKRIRDEIPKEGPSVKEENLNDLQGLDQLYDRANSMPVWPFDLRIMGNFLTTIAIPLIIILIQQLFFRGINF